MAYSVLNPPALMAQPLTGGIRQWSYRTTEDAAATIDTIGYVTNGWDLGMRAGDLVLVRDGAGLITTHTVITAVSTNVDLGTGTTIGSTANSD